MKTSKINLILTVILICLSSNVYSQTDSIKTFYTKSFSISYIDEFKNIYDDAAKKNIRVADIKTVNDFNKLSFIRDTLIRISGKDNSNMLLNLNKINEIRFINHSNTWKGIGIGAAAGTVIGALIGFLHHHHGNTKGWLLGGEIIAGSILGLPLGAIIGGVIGASNQSSESYEFSKFRDNKKNALIKILKTKNNR